MFWSAMLDNGAGAAAMASSIFQTCFKGQPSALLMGYAELLKPESNCEVAVRLRSLQSALPSLTLTELAGSYLMSIFSFSIPPFLRNREN